MSGRLVNPPELPEPRGSSHAVVAGNTVYLAGQIGDGETLADQFDAAAANLLTALKAAGGGPDDLVSLQLFVPTSPSTATRARRSAAPGASTSAAGIRRWGCSGWPRWRTLRRRSS